MVIRITCGPQYAFILRYWKIKRTDAFIITLNVSRFNQHGDILPGSVAFTLVGNI